MKVFDCIKSKNLDEFAEWLDKHGAFDDSPWMDWFDNNYCNKCKPEIVYVPELKEKSECSWCELHKKCKYFMDINEIPNNKQIIKMWLKLENEY